MGVDYSAYAVVGVRLDPIRANLDELRNDGLLCYWGTDHDYVYVGIATGEDTYSNGGDDDSFVSLQADDVAQIKEKLREYLEPIGLWDEKQFGLWSVLYCSY